MESIKNAWRNFKSKRAQKHRDALKDPSELVGLLDGFEEYEEEEIVPEGRILGIGSSLSEGQIASNKAEGRFMRIFKNDPYEPFETTLSKALDGMEIYLDSRIGKKAVKPLRKQLKKIMEAYLETNNAYKVLHPMIRKVESGEEPQPRERDLKSNAKAVNDGLDNLESAVVGVVEAIRGSQEILTSHIKGESKKNISKHYENLHPRTVMVFAGLEKANTYLSIGIGAVATLVGHPEVGVTIKTVISGLLSASKQGARFVQEQMDFRDEETMSEAQPLISRDEEDMLTVDNVKKAYSVASTVTKKALDLAGVDMSFIDEIKAYVPDFDAEIDDALSSVFGKITDAIETGTPVDGMVDQLASEGQSAIKEKLDEAKEVIKEKLQQKAEEQAQKVLTEIEKAIRGERREEGMDLDGRIEELDYILEELDNPSEIYQALNRMLNQTTKEGLNVPQLRKDAKEKYDVEFGKISEDDPARKFKTLRATVEWLCEPEQLDMPDQAPYYS